MLSIDTRLVGGRQKHPFFRWEGQPIFLQLSGGSMFPLTNLGGVLTIVTIFRGKGYNVQVTHFMDVFDTFPIREIR